MHAIIAGTLAYTLTYFGISTVVAAAALWREGLGRLDDAAMAAATTAFAALVGAAAFTLVTAGARAWRDQPAVRAASIGILAGAVGFMLHTPVLLHLMMVAVLRSLASAPAVGLAILYGYPGIVAGAIALVVALVMRPDRRPTR
jgi:Trk-type K+ transport system membrane component